MKLAIGELGKFRGVVLNQSVLNGMIDDMDGYLNAKTSKDMKTGKKRRVRTWREKAIANARQKIYYVENKEKIAAYHAARYDNVWRDYLPSHMCSVLTLDAIDYLQTERDDKWRHYDNEN